MTPILQAVHVTKAYATLRGTLSAVEDINLAVSQGEFVCLVGPSGCGKSTLLRLLGGLLLPDHGQVYVQGRPLSGPTRTIGIVFQKANLMPWRTVFDNVLLPLQVHHVPQAEARARVEQVLRLVDLSAFAHSYPHELSGGMEQRVAIARALAHEPQILLLDEPFGALDALTRERLNLELLRVWEASRKTAVMVTHDIREAVFLADRVVVLTQRPGRVTLEVAITLPRPRTPEVLYSDAFNALAQQVRRAIEQGCEQVAP
ncbi:MAG: ABC transporter ATP-binding protein [Anaerolineae bacterium]